jgi:rhamnosyltransferase
MGDSSREPSPPVHPPKGNRVLAVVVTYQPDLQQLETTLRSLSQQVDGIALVDNTPEGGLPELKRWQQEARQRFAGAWAFIPNQRNLGIAAAQNIGIRLAIQQGYSHVLLSDQDTTFSADAVSHLLGAHDALSRAGRRVAAVAAGYENPLRPGQIDVVFLRHEGLTWRHLRGTRGLCRISYAIASGTLIPTPVFQQVGLMEESLFIDWVDVEWCLRATRKGFELFGSADARTLHQLGDGVGHLLGRPMTLHSPRRCYTITRNAVRLAIHHSSPRGLQRLRFAWLAMVYCLIMPWLHTRPLQHLHFALRGVGDGLLNRGGALPPGAEVSTTN